MEIPPEPRGPFLRECSQTSLFPLSRRPDSLLARVWLHRRGFPPSPLKLCGFGTPFLAGSSFPNFPHWRWQTDIQGGGSGTGSTFRDACQPSQHPGLHLPRSSEPRSVSRAQVPGAGPGGAGTRRGSGGGTRLPPQQQEGLLGLRAERAPAAGRQRRSRLRDPPALPPPPLSSLSASSAAEGSFCWGRRKHHPPTPPGSGACPAAASPCGAARRGSRGFTAKS